MAKNKTEREHVTSFIYNNSQMFKLGHLIAKGILKRPDIRITIDTKEDFKLLNIIYENLYHDNLIPIFQVIKFLNKNPLLIKINQESEKVHLVRNKNLHQKMIIKK